MSAGGQMKIIFVNGPNLGLLGLRQPEIYGSETLQDIEKKLSEFCSNQQIKAEFFQSDSEGELVKFFGTHFLEQHHLNKNNLKNNFAIVFNPGAYAHTSVALADSLSMFKSLEVPIIEVHISNVYARQEEFRKHSFVSEVATGVVSGLGTVGYLLAARFCVENFKIRNHS